MHDCSHRMKRCIASANCDFSELSSLSRVKPKGKCIYNFCNNRLESPLQRRSSSAQNSADRFSAQNLSTSGTLPSELFIFAHWTTRCALIELTRNLDKAKPLLNKRVTQWLTLRTVSSRYGAFAARLRSQALTPSRPQQSIFRLPASGFRVRRTMSDLINPVSI